MGRMFLLGLAAALALLMTLSVAGGAGAATDGGQPSVGPGVLVD